MKTLKIKVLFAALVVLPLYLLNAQESKNQAFYVHEDQVKPSNKFQKSLRKPVKPINWQI